MGEFIWVHIGQAGIQIGVQFWNRMMKEHYIGSDGRPTKDGPRGNVDSMFDMNEKEQFIPRAVFIDTDSMAIEEAMKTDVGQLWESNQFVYGKEAAIYHSRGQYTIGRNIIDKWIESTLIQASKWKK